MLNTLKRIVQEVNAAADFDSALSLLVDLVREALSTEVCSVFVFDRTTHQYVLMATRGLNQDAVGVEIPYSHGLVGLVGSREEPINLEDAASHPRYHYIAETGEERFKSFLGVPIVHHRRVMGVLVVQQRTQRRFSEEDEAFLVTLSAQLAAVMAHAEATGKMSAAVSHGDHTQGPLYFSGAGAAPGVAIGTAVVMSPKAHLASVPDRVADNVDDEIQAFKQAIKATRDEIQQVAERMSKELRPEELALFDVYVQMLNDDTLGNEVIVRIQAGQWAQGALRQVILEYVHHFEMMEDSYLRERATDIRDLGVRVLAQLQSTSIEYNFPEDTVLVAEEISPAMFADVPEHKLRGLISVRGSANSHAAILARARGIPTVMGVVDLPCMQLDAVKVIVDGYQGRLFTDPNAEILTQYRRLAKEEQAMIRGFEPLKKLPSETTDGHKLRLLVNTGLTTDSVRSRERGAEGVGLYRTEVPFMMMDRFPSEQEQRDIYRQHLATFAPDPVTMRTLDIGGDKSLNYFPIKEDNPFLGWRGIRVTLDHPELFLQQVRAMLKASQDLNNLHIMLPMIASVTEVEEAAHLIFRAFCEVRDEGYYIQMPKVGVMIEVPAAVYQIKAIAQRVDFLSVGSNDLTQYLLAVDRNNPRVADVYDSLHPSVLMALDAIVQGAHEVGRPVSVCGEMAGNPATAIILMAMGYDMLSMNATHLLWVKSVLRQVSLAWAKALLSDIMLLDNAPLIRSTVELAFDKAGLGRLLNPTKG
jgi:phosphotransferase system enzyme I (PtsP)